MFSETGSLMETWAQQPGYVGQQAPERDLPVFSTGVTSRQFYDMEETNSGPHASMGSTFQTQLFSQPGLNVHLNQDSFDLL